VRGQPSCSARAGQPARLLGFDQALVCVVIALLATEGGIVLALVTAAPVSFFVTTIAFICYVAARVGAPAVDRLRGQLGVAAFGKTGNALVGRQFHRLGLAQVQFDAAKEPLMFLNMAGEQFFERSFCCARELAFNHAFGIAAGVAKVLVAGCRGNEQGRGVCAFDRKGVGARLDFAALSQDANAGLEFQRSLDAAGGAVDAA